MAGMPTAAAPHDPPVVLLVDGDTDTREMYGLALAMSGFAVEEARNAREALNKTKKGIPDVVVADISLPGNDGFALCRAIKRHRRTAGIPVIAVTGYSSPARVEEAQRAGFETLLLKPCSPDVLLVQIRRTIQKSRALQAASGQLRTQAATLRERVQDATHARTESVKGLCRRNRAR